MERWNLAIYLCTVHTECHGYICKVLSSPVFFHYLSDFTLQKAQCDPKANRTLCDLNYRWKATEKMTFDFSWGLCGVFVKASMYNTFWEEWKECLLCVCVCSVFPTFASLLGSASRLAPSLTHTATADALSSAWDIERGMGSQTVHNAIHSSVTSHRDSETFSCRICESK